MVHLVPEDWDARDEQDHAGFFIAPDECVDCGCCEVEAPANFAALRSPGGELLGGFTVVRQPKSETELRAVVRATQFCTVDCIYYGGRDPRIIETMRAAGTSPECIVHCVD